MSPSGAHVPDVIPEVTVPVGSGEGEREPGPAARGLLCLRRGGRKGRGRGGGLAGAVGAAEVHELDVLAGQQELGHGVFAVEVTAAATAKAPSDASSHPEPKMSD
jgi:hypothetical protein